MKRRRRIQVRALGREGVRHAWLCAWALAALLLSALLAGTANAVKPEKAKPQSQARVMHKRKLPPAIMIYSSEVQKL